MLDSDPILRFQKRAVIVLAGVCEVGRGYLRSFLPTEYWYGFVLGYAWSGVMDLGKSEIAS